ncbi:NmrA family NAD(P)-binding protein [Kineococcus sp. SYSU DK002]|uniref:NmrA family NAD(P)-binding protein n=1 Tax=Kineococcus sp. SYSU DK002 TaxID=3383123 RepID=UPI003D7E6072
MTTTTTTTTTTDPTPTAPTGPVLVLGGTGTTGRRVAQRLREAGHDVRIASRAGRPPFEWADPATWGPLLDGASAAYVAHAPDLAAPGAPDVVTAFAREAVRCGVDRLVLLSGRGEEEARRAEDQVRRAAPGTVVVRASFFMQDFDEKLLVDQVRAGLVRLPVGAVREPFVDAEDVAAVAAVALTDPRHAGTTYEVSGPELLTFAQALALVSAATGRDVRFQEIPVDEHRRELLGQGVPAEVVDLLTYLFTEVLDGRGERLSRGVQDALGREPGSFADYARRAAATGAWDR